MLLAYCSMPYLTYSPPISKPAHLIALHLLMACLAVHNIAWPSELSRAGRHGWQSQQSQQWTPVHSLPQMDPPEPLIPSFSQSIARSPITCPNADHDLGGDKLQQVLPLTQNHSLTHSLHLYTWHVLSSLIYLPHNYTNSTCSRLYLMRFSKVSTLSSGSMSEEVIHKLRDSGVGVSPCIPWRNTYNYTTTNALETKELDPNSNKKINQMKSN